MQLLQPTFATLSPLPLYRLDRTGGMGYVTACLFSLQTGENGSPTTLISGNSEELGHKKGPELLLCPGPR